MALIAVVVNSLHLFHCAVEDHFLGSPWMLFLCLLSPGKFDGKEIWRELYEGRGIKAGEEENSHFSREIGFMLRLSSL